MRLALLVLSLFCGSCLSARAQLFEIARPVFSGFVTDDGNYTPVGPAANGQISRASLTHGLLYFSFTVVGGQTTLDRLAKDRRLDVEAVILGNQSEIIPGLGILQQNWIANMDAWISQFNQLGYFTFRTFMNTQKISNGVIEIQIRDGNNNVIRPVAYNSVTYKASVTIVP